jgi:PAS domain S-box-containing protein
MRDAPGSNPPPRQTLWPRRVSLLAGVTSLLLGVLVLGGWWFGAARIVQPIPGWPSMVPNTAVCFVFLGISLLLLRRPRILLPWWCVAQVFGVAAIVLASLTLAEYATGRDLGNDRLLLGGPLNSEAEFPVRRSGAGSAGAFVLIGLALLMVDLRRRSRTDLSEAFAICAVLVSLTMAAGYAYGATLLYEDAIPGVGTAPHSVVELLVLSAGVLCVRPNRPLIALVTSDRAGGFVVRRLLVGASAIPVLGLLVIWGYRRSLYNEPFAEALLAVAAMAIAVGLVVSTGHLLDRIDVERTRSEQALAEREERLRLLIQHASDGVFIADLDGHFIEVNDALCIMLGCPREDLVDKRIIDFIAPHDVPRLNTARATLLRGDAEVDEWTVVRRDRTTLPVEVSMRILHGGRWQGLVRDISARKEVERATDAVAEAVTQSPEASLKAVLETITLEAKLVANAEYAAVGVGGDRNRPFDPWVFVGMSSEEASRLAHAPRPVGLLGLVAVRNQSIRVTDLEHHPSFRGYPPNHPHMTSFLGVPIRRHGRSVGNLFLANKRGSAEFTMADQRAVERIAARAGTAIETARLYQAESLERAWLASMIDQMPEGVILTDSTGATHIENRSMQFFAHDTGERDQRGQPVRYDLRLSDGQPVALRDQPQVRALVDGTTTIGQEFLLRHPDGRMLPMLVSAAPVFDAQRNRSGAVTIYQDISTLKELERMREEWSTVVAHDLRQPLGIIALEAEALSRKFDRQETAGAPKVIERIRRSTKNLNAMINDLLDVSRIESRRLMLERVETDLASWLDEAVERLASLATGSAVRFQARVRPAPALIDPMRFEQVLGNLISNAVKYGKLEDEIVIDLSVYGLEFKVAVINHGRGIAPADIPKLFQRFARSEAARGEVVPGLGLGLYISKGLVEAHGGHIWAESIPGETTAFHFTVPMLSKGTQVAA